MEKRIIFATGNEGKMREIRMILGDLGVPVVSMKEAGAAADIEENGTSFEENAIIKARTIMKKTGEITMADDSGLEIDALGGEPGIYSARYMGEDTSYDIKNNLLLDKLKGVPDEKRTARFVSVITCCMPDGTTILARGSCDGVILHSACGENGFGYDPLFYVPKEGKTFAGWEDSGQMITADTVVQMTGEHVLTAIWK